MSFLNDLTQFSMRDIGLAGVFAFFMQCPSFLSHQRQICEGIGHGRSNCQTVLGMEHIPSDDHIRIMLDDDHSVTSILPEGVAIGEHSVDASAPQASRKRLALSTHCSDKPFERILGQRVGPRIRGDRLSARSQASLSPPGTPAEPDIAARARIS
jgi:hypothetical protein